MVLWDYGVNDNPVLVYGANEEADSVYGVKDKKGLAYGVGLQVTRSVCGVERQEIRDNKRSDYGVDHPHHKVALVYGAEANQNKNKTDSKIWIQNTDHVT